MDEHRAAFKAEEDSREAWHAFGYDESAFSASYLDTYMLATISRLYTLYSLPLVLLSRAQHSEQDNTSLTY
jgi:hypothetical protein